jgi:hypothetical protein
VQVRQAVQEALPVEWKLMNWLCASAAVAGTANLGESGIGTTQLDCICSASWAQQDVNDVAAQ